MRSHPNNADRPSATEAWSQTWSYGFPRRRTSGLFPPRLRRCQSRRPFLTINSAGSIRFVDTSMITADGLSAGGNTVLCAAEPIELRGTSSVCPLQRLARLARTAWVVRFVRLSPDGLESATDGRRLAITPPEYAVMCHRPCSRLLILWAIAFVFG